MSLIEKKKSMELNKVLSSENSSRESQKRLERIKGLEKCVSESRVKVRLLDMIIQVTRLS